MDKLLKFLGLTFLVVAVLLYRLFVLTKLWAIIAVKMFALPPMGLWQILAISYLLGAFATGYETIKTNTAKDIAVRCGEQVIALTLSWLIASYVFG